MKRSVFLHVSYRDVTLSNVKTLIDKYFCMVYLIVHFRRPLLDLCWHIVGKLGRKEIDIVLGMGRGTDR